MNGDEEIFCDDSSRADMMKRVFKGRMIPLIIIFFCVIIPQIYMQSHLDGVFFNIFTGVFIALGIIYLVLFILLGIQFFKYWKL